MDYGNPLANGLSEQPHVSDIFQRGSQSPRMGFEMTDARASQTQTPPDFGETCQDLNIAASCRTKTCFSLVYLVKTTASFTCHLNFLPKLSQVSMLRIKRVKETAPRGHILPSDQYGPGQRLGAPDSSWPQQGGHLQPEDHKPDHKTAS